MTEKKESQRQKVLNRELDWINTSAQGRRKKSQARISAFEQIASQNGAEESSDAIIQIAPGPRLGDKVLAVRKVDKAYGDNTLLKDCSFDLPRGGIVGVIGPNGIGKTTLFRMIVGGEKPDVGTMRAALASRARLNGRGVLERPNRHRESTPRPELAKTKRPA